MRRGEVLAGTKTALVTGASKGIGRCYALQLAALGYNVLMVASGEAELLSTAEEVRTANPNVWVRTLVKDLATPTAAEELFAWTEAEGIKVDVLINNAGIFSFCDILNTPIERIQRMIYLHDITSTLNCRLYAADMIKRGGGRILNMSSFSIWMPYPGLSLYSASKAYLKSFSVAFAKEVKDKGVPFNPLEMKDPDITLSAAEREIGGLGIFITKKTMDTVAYRFEDGQNILTMTKKI